MIILLLFSLLLDTPASAAISKSFLDQDLYKFTTGYLYQYDSNREIVDTNGSRSRRVTFDFTDRGFDKTSQRIPTNPKFMQELIKEIKAMSDLRMSENDIQALERLNPFKTVDKIKRRSFLNHFQNQIFHPEIEIKNWAELLEMTNTDSEEKPLRITVEAELGIASFYEIFLMTIVSEVRARYLSLEDRKAHKTLYSELEELSLQNQGELKEAVIPKGSLIEKVIDQSRRKLLDYCEEGIRFVEFGTRRRFSKDLQELIVRDLKFTSENTKNRKGFPCTSTFVGTSNVYLALKYDLSAIGSIPHEYTMYQAGVNSEQNANFFAYVSMKEHIGAVHSLTDWAGDYASAIGLCQAMGLCALSGVRPQSVLIEKSDLLTLRHDSGDPIEWYIRQMAFLRHVNIMPDAVRIIFSDGLKHTDESVQKIIKTVHFLNESPATYQFCSPEEEEIFKDRIKNQEIVFGIGTDFTHDVEAVGGPKNPNIVVKMSSVEQNDGIFKNVAKLSNTRTKFTGPQDAIDRTVRDLDYDHSFVQFRRDFKTYHWEKSEDEWTQDIEKLK